MKSAPSNPVNFSPDMPAVSAMYLLSVFSCFPAAFKVVQKTQDDAWEPCIPQPHVHSGLFPPWLLGLPVFYTTNPTCPFSKKLHHAGSSDFPKHYCATQPRLSTEF